MVNGVKKPDIVVESVYLKYGGKVSISVVDIKSIHPGFASDNFW